MALLADDGTGFGIADNVLLPFVMLGMVAVHMSMDPPASDQRLGLARQELPMVASRQGIAAMSNSDELPEELGEELYQAMLPIHRQFGKLPFEELKARLLQVGDTLAPRFTAMGYPLAALEARRQVAHDILVLSLNGEHTLEECTEYFDHSVRLGFIDLYAKARTVTMFAGYLSRQEGGQAQSRRILLPLRDELGDALMVEEVAVYRTILEDIEKRLARSESESESESRNSQP